MYPELKDENPAVKLGIGTLNPKNYYANPIKTDLMKNSVT